MFILGEKNNKIRQQKEFRVRSWSIKCESFVSIEFFQFPWSWFKSRNFRSQRNYLEEEAKELEKYAEIFNLL